MVSQVNFKLWLNNPAKFWKIASWLIPSIGLGLIWVASRIWGVLPKILGDELTYSMNARHLPLADSTVPNYFFNLVFGLTNGCGYGFYTCGKSINMIFLVGFAVFIYLAARQLVEPPVALVVGFLALLGPISAYASYFTPDMMFYFGAAIVIYLVLRTADPSRIGRWALIGLTLGLVTLVKPHALFLIPPIVLYLVFLGVKAGRSQALKTALSVIAFVATTFAIKFALGFAFAGEKGFSIFGGGYDYSATSVITGANAAEGWINPPEVEPLVTGGALSATIWQILFHVSYLLIFFGLPVLFAIIKSARSIKKGRALTTDSRVAVFLFFAFGTLIAVSAVFVSVSGSFGEILQNRVMIRYYEYLIPFLPLAVLVGFNSVKEVGKLSRWIITGLVAIWFGISMPYLSTLVPAQFTDSSLMAAAIKSGVSLWVFAGISLAVIIYWAVKPIEASKVWLYGVAPAVVLLYAISSYTNMTVMSSVVGPYTTASRFAHDNLTFEQRQKLIVVGITNQNVQAAQLWIDAPKATSKTVPDGGNVNINDFPEETRYLLIVGNLTIEGDGFLLKQSDSWALIENATPEEAAAAAAK